MKTKINLLYRYCLSILLIGTISLFSYCSINYQWKDTSILILNLIYPLGLIYDLYLPYHGAMLHFMIMMIVYSFGLSISNLLIIFVNSMLYTIMAIVSCTLLRLFVQAERKLNLLLITICLLIPFLFATNMSIFIELYYNYDTIIDSYKEILLSNLIGSIVVIMCISLPLVLILWYLPRISKTESSQAIFLSNMSHELRTPLNALLGSIQLLETTNLSNEQNKYLDVCNNASEMMLSIINDILDYSKLEAGALETRSTSLCLKNLIQNSVNIILQQASMKDINIVLDISEQCPDEIIVDGKLIQQVLVNFLGNAIKFTPKGFIRVAIKSIKNKNFNNDTEAMKFLQRQKSGFSSNMPTNYRRMSTSISRTSFYKFDNRPVQYSCIQFEVEDTGCGIHNEKNVEALFHRFYQSDSSSTKIHEGTGLGLAISLRIAALFHGQVGAITNSYNGATFWFNIWVRKTSTSINSNVNKNEWNSLKLIKITESPSMSLLKNTKLFILHYNKDMLTMIKEQVKLEIDNVEVIKTPNKYFSKKFIQQTVNNLLSRSKHLNYILLIHESVLPSSELTQLPVQIRKYLLNHTVYFGCESNETNSTSTLNESVMRLTNPLDIQELLKTLAAHLNYHNPNISQQNRKSKILSTYKSAPMPKACRNNAVPSNYYQRNATTYKITHKKDSTTSSCASDYSAAPPTHKRQVTMDVLFHESSRYQLDSLPKIDRINSTNDDVNNSNKLSKRNKSAIQTLMPTTDETTFTPNILIVEDNRLNQVVVVNLLRRCGNFKTSCVKNGKEGVNAYKESLINKKSKFDAILMDCYMPVMDGFEATRNIREIEKQNKVHENNSIPIIAFTASTTLADHDLCIQSGMNEIVTKPVRLAELSETLLHCIKKSEEVVTEIKSSPESDEVIHTNVPHQSLSIASNDGHNIISSNIEEKYSVSAYSSVTSVSGKRNSVDSTISTKDTKRVELPKVQEVQTINTELIKKTKVDLSKSQEVTPQENDHIKVLMVEDNRMNQVILLNLLKRSGNFRITTTSDGLEGVKQFKKSLHLQKYYDVILMDCYMPNMNGFEATTNIRQIEKENHITSTIPIIAVTASTTADDHTKCVDSGMNAIVNKPVRIQLLLDTMKKHVPSFTNVFKSSRNLKKKATKVAA